jgi:hypothetical protein
MGSQPSEMFLLHFCAFQDEFENFSEGIFDLFLVAVGRSSESRWGESKISCWIHEPRLISDWLQRLDFDQNLDFDPLSKMGFRLSEMFLLHFCAFQDNFSEGIYERSKIRFVENFKDNSRHRIPSEGFFESFSELLWFSCCDRRIFVSGTHCGNTIWNVAPILTLPTVFQSNSVNLMGCGSGSAGGTNVI